MMTRRHALVTGGAGFIGSHLVDLLIARGFDVTVLDCLSPQVHSDAEVDADGWPVYLNRAARRIKGNLLDRGVFEASLENVTHLAHLAAYVGVGQSMTEIANYTRNNTLASAAMLETLSLVPHTVKRIVVASSMSIYGEGQYWRRSTKEYVAPSPRSSRQLERRIWECKADESSEEELEPVPTTEDKPLQPASIYAINKRDQEEMFLVVGRALGIPTIALRLFNTYGSRQSLGNPYTGVAAIFIARLLNNEAPLVFEDGNQKRDLVHVRDVASAFATMLEDDKPMWKAFNVGTGNAIAVKDIASTLARLLNKDIAPRVLEKYRVGDVRHCFADISKIRREFGFRPGTSFDGGMKELIDWVEVARKPRDRSSESMSELVQYRLVV